MVTLRPTFNFRIEELLPLARLLRASYVRDQKDLADLLPDDYTPAYLKGYDQLMDDAETLVRSSVSIAERQVITAHIAEELVVLPTLLNHLEARVRKAQPLTVLTKAFGIEAARTARNSDDHEALEDALKTLLHNVAQNSKALVAKGQKPAETQQIQDLYDQLVADTTAQGSSVSNQRILTAANVDTLNTLYAEMAELMADGKALYKASDKARAKDYTVTQLLKRVRRAQAAPDASTPA